MSDPTRDLLPADLREWAELSAKHHRSLRRPYATGRPLPDDEQLGDDRQQHDGAADREQERPASDH